MKKNRMVQLIQITGNEKIGKKLQAPLLRQQNNWDKKFKSTVAEAQTIIIELESTSAQIDRMKSQYKKLTDQKKQNEISSKLNKIIQKNTRDIARLKQLLQNMQKETKSHDKASTEFRIVSQTYHNLIQKIKNTITKSNQAQQDFKLTAKDKIKRHTKIIKRDMSQSQLQEVVNNPEKGQQLLQQRLFHQPSVQLQNAVSDIQDKYRDMIKLEKNIQQCLKLMQDLGILVQYQGQALNNIQIILDETHGYMENAEEKLIRAKQLHKKSRKKICCLILLLVGIIGVITVPIIFSQISI